MEAWHIALIVCGGILLLFVLFVIFIRVSNRKRFNRLQTNLKKLEQEKNDFENDNKISIVDPEKRKLEDSGAVIEDYEPDKREEILEPQIEDEIFDLPHEEMPNLIEMEEERKLAQKRRDAEFESFMEEHAFSRKILDKNLIDKLKKLPPEIQSVILNNVLDKYDD